MRHGSLFSGGGGFDLAAQWMGWENVFHCEISTFCQTILKYYWPKAISYGDITTTDFRVHRGKLDIISGGFPCQPFSQAGKRKGTADDRYLWPQMLRVIGEVQPRFVVGENVGGLVNWDRGMVFEQVQADLEAAGYEVAAFILPACGVNAPHRRDRIWFVAHACGSRISNRKTGSISNEQRIVSGEVQGCKQPYRFTANGNGWSTANTNIDKRCERRMHEGGQQEAERYAGTRDSWFSRTAWENFPTQSPVCSGNDGLPTDLDGITVSKWRTESIKAAGNAIVPQVAFEIFKSIASIPIQSG